MAELERRVPEFTLITQNVDGLHRRAGSQNVLKLHGNINRTKCFRENIVIDEWPDTGETPPPCPRCGGLLRTDVVWYGENLPAQVLQASIEAARACTCSSPSAPRPWFTRPPPSLTRPFG